MSTVQTKNAEPLRQRPYHANAAGEQTGGPLRVAVVMPLGEQRGGGELMLVHLMQQGTDLGIEWHIVFQEAGPLVEALRPMAMSVEVIPAGRLREPHRILDSVRKLAASFRARRIQAVLSWMGKPHLYAGPAAMLAGIPSLWYQLATPDDGNIIDRLATLIPSKGIITLSKMGEKAQASLWPHRPGKLVYPGVELERFAASEVPTPQEARQKLGLPAEGPLIGILGRMQRWKGFHVMLEAMPRILASHPDARCVLVGGEDKREPEYPGFLNKRIADLNLSENVLQVGHQKNVPEWMQAMDVIVHASDREPFGIVVLEAMALSKPVVAGDEGGPTEIITEGVNGLLTPFEDAPALAGTVLRYLDDPEFARRVGKAARLRAEDFSTRKYAEALVAAIHSLLRTVPA